MHSSTSSSNERVPNLAHGRMWLLIILITALACTGAELAWRALGHRPSIVDDPAWWAFHRGRIYTKASKTVVLVGASRMNLGFSTATFRARFPDYEVVNLAVGGHFSMDVIRDLAYDEEFDGIVLCSAQPSGAMGREDMSEYLDAYYHPSSFDRKLKRIIASRLQQSFAFINPRVQTAQTLRRLLGSARTLPKPLHVIMHYDRTGSADFTLIDIEQYRRTRIDSVLKDPQRFTVENREEWLERVNAVEGFVERIQARGGNVVFIVFPTTDVSLSVPEQQNPKAEYWDQFAKITKGIPIHFLDYPALLDFDCPDTSHLDFRDSPRFTNGLLDVLERLGLFDMK